MENNKVTIKDIVKNQLCTGCGMCVSQDKTNSLKMEWNEEGFLTPHQVNKGEISIEAVRVCPFNPYPDDVVKDEDKLADLFFTSSCQRDEKIGKFINTYVGYSGEFRETSSSGGIATYVFEQLLKENLVDHLYIVKDVKGSYEYQLFSNFEQIKQISKTRYIPVTLEKLFLNIDKIEGKIAISGVACFIKAIRLKQYYNPELREKIPFLIGIICGGLKSKFFTDYLAQKAGIKGDYKKQDYRIKKPDSSALDYSFGAFDKQNAHHKVAMQTIGDMWGTGMFKSNACDFCDDVTSELADLSLGDAWLKPYNDDGLGNSVIVTRTSVADKLILAGIDKNELYVKPLAVELFKLSQQGSFNHRHDGLKYRLEQLRNESKIIPVKRSRFLISIPYYFKRVQKQRMIIRANSLKYWINTRNAIQFDSLMEPMKNKLLGLTIFYHRMRSFKKIIFIKK